MTEELACAVLSYRDEPFLIEAVRSVTEQDVPVEVVVINSGGGNPAARLAAAGLNVPVSSCEERLYAGGARNAGIELTRARYVSFLAADCIAAPGWAAARLREHRAGAAVVASPLDNAYPDSLVAWAALLTLHNRRVASALPTQRLYYSLSYERALFERFGRFREDLRSGEDTEFNARFAGHVPTLLAHDAVTLHRYPTRLRDLIADAFWRGGMQARAQGALEGAGPKRIRVALRGPYNMAHSALVAWRSTAPKRGRLLRAWPLGAAAALAFACGALTASRQARDR